MRSAEKANFFSGLADEAGFDAEMTLLVLKWRPGACSVSRQIRSSARADLIR
jgi:hypothetical protein